MTEQQIRNCTIRLLDSKFNEFVVEMAEAKSFKATTSFLTTEQRKGWYDQELVLRFFAFKNDLASYVHEIGDFLTEYMERVSDKASDKHLVFEYENEQEIFEKTFDIFEASLGERAFSRVNTKGTDLVEAFGIYHYESLTLGIQPFIQFLNSGDSAQMKKLAEVLLNLKKHQDFVTLTKGGGKNSLGLLKRRIEYVTNMVRQGMGF